jgi:hypothetical protein
VILDGIEVRHDFSDHLADAEFTALALTHRVKFLSPDWHVGGPVGSDCVAPIDQLSDACRWQRHAIFVGEKRGAQRPRCRRAAFGIARQSGTDRPVPTQNSISCEVRGCGEQV